MSGFALAWLIMAIVGMLEGGIVSSILLWILSPFALLIAMYYQYLDNVRKLREHPKLKVSRVWTVQEKESE